MTNNAPTGKGATAICANCCHFRNDATFMDSEIPASNCPGSGYASARADDGICLTHGRLTDADLSCREFAGEGG